MTIMYEKTFIGNNFSLSQNRDLIEKKWISKLVEKPAAVADWMLIIDRLTLQKIAGFRD